MQFRYLFTFLIFLSGILISNHAFSRVILQDSVKKVSIKVIVSEKQKALDFDSLLTSDAVSRSVTNSARNYNSKKTTSKVIEEVNTSPTPQEPIEILPKAISQNPDAKENSSPTSKPVIKDVHSDDDHAEELINRVLTNENKSLANETDRKASRTYLWVGFMLVVVGVILGILFGKIALLISIAGVVFVIIGYNIT